MLDHLEFCQKQIELHIAGKTNLLLGLTLPVYRECFLSVYNHFAYSGELLPIESLERSEKMRIYQVAVFWFKGERSSKSPKILTEMSKMIYLIENLTGNPCKQAT